VKITFEDCTPVAPAQPAAITPVVAPAQPVAPTPFVAPPEPIAETLAVQVAPREAPANTIVVAKKGGGDYTVSADSRITNSGNGSSIIRAEARPFVGTIAGQRYTLGLFGEGDFATQTDNSTGWTWYRDTWFIGPSATVEGEGWKARLNFGVGQSSDQRRRPDSWVERFQERITSLVDLRVNFQGGEKWLVDPELDLRVTSPASAFNSAPEIIGTGGVGLFRQPLDEHLSLGPDLISGFNSGANGTSYGVGLGLSLNLEKLPYGVTGKASVGVIPFFGDESYTFLQGGIEINF